MSNVKDTSKDAYTGLTFLGTKSKLSKMQKAIMKQMEYNQEYTRKELAAKTGMETSTIAGRVNELVKSGAIIIVGKKICSISNKNVESLMKERELIKFINTTKTLPF
tara:strand:- start:307 stop:627 length:321 start_codon:yes stop_codon:yes gene_type:complete